MFPTLYSLKHSVGTGTSCHNEGFYRIKSPTKMLGISLLAILVLPSSLSFDSLTADMILTSIQRQQQPLQNLITRTDTCPDLIDVDPGSTAYNSQNIECVQQHFNSCTLSDFLLVYGLGSVHVSIKGKNNDTVCSIEFRQETEMGKSNIHSCLIPLDKITTWNSWKNADGVTALDDILSFCNNIA